jgi:hypothetical protein
MGSGRGANGCADVDECAAGSDNCDNDPNACRNTVGGFECGCPNGFSGNGVGSDGCRDIDECASNADDCDEDPQACRNTAGGFECRCPTGFEGNGRGSGGCTDVDECARDNGGCHPQRRCMNTVGSNTCGSCAAGWGVDGDRQCERCECFEIGGDSACRSSQDSLPRGATGSLAATATLSSGTLFGYQFDLPGGSQVRRFVARRSGGGSPGIRMALYSDSGNLPGARLAHSDQLSFSGDQASGNAILDVQECVSGKFWLVAVADGELTLGQGADSVPSVLTPAAGSDLPATWPGGGGRNGSTLGLYVEVNHP